MYFLCVELEYISNNPPPADPQNKQYLVIKQHDLFFQALPELQQYLTIKYVQITRSLSVIMRIT